MAYVTKTFDITVTPGTIIPNTNNTITCTWPIPGIFPYRNVGVLATKTLELDTPGGSATYNKNITSIDFLNEKITFTITTTIFHGGTPVITAARLILNSDAATYMNNYFATSKNDSGIGNWLEYDRCTSSLTSLSEFKVPLFEGCLRYPSFPSTTITSSTYSPGGFIYDGKIELSKYFKENATIYALKRGYIPHYTSDCVYSNNTIGLLGSDTTITIKRTDQQLNVSAISGGTNLEMTSPSAETFPNEVVPYRLFVSLQAAGGGGAYYTGILITTPGTKGGGSGARWTGIINISNDIISKVVITLGGSGRGGTDDSDDTKLGVNASNSSIEWYDNDNNLIDQITVQGGLAGGRGGSTTKANIEYSDTGEGNLYWTILGEKGALGGSAGGNLVNGLKSGEDVGAVSVYYVPSSFTSYSKCNYSHDAYSGGKSLTSGLVGGNGGAASASGNGGDYSSVGGLGAGGGSGVVADKDGGNGGTAKIELSY